MKGFILSFITMACFLVAGIMRIGGDLFLCVLYFSLSSFYLYLSATRGWPIFRRWMFVQYQQPFTVACDRSGFWSPINQREELFLVYGMANARWTARKWVRGHDSGQARILKGHHSFEAEKG